MPKKTIALIDDHPIILNGIKDGLKYNPYLFEFQIFGSMIDLRPFLEKGKIDLLVTDLTMPDMDGFQIIEEAKLLAKNLKIAVFTQHDSELIFRRVFDLGIDGFILKSEPFIFLPQIFERILAGEFYVSKQLEKFTKPTRCKENFDSLEAKIIQLLLEGKTNKDIADTLDRSIKVIEYRIRKIKNKMDVKNTKELIRITLSKY